MRDEFWAATLPVVLALVWDFSIYNGPMRSPPLDPIHRAVYKWTYWIPPLLIATACAASGGRVVEGDGSVVPVIVMALTLIGVLIALAALFVFPRIVNEQQVFVRRGKLRAPREFHFYDARRRRRWTLLGASIGVTVTNIVIAEIVSR